MKLHDRTAGINLPDKETQVLRALILVYNAACDFVCSSDETEERSYELYRALRHALELASEALGQLPDAQPDGGGE